MTSKRALWGWAIATLAGALVGGCTESPRETGGRLLRATHLDEIDGNPVGAVAGADGARLQRGGLLPFVVTHGTSRCAKADVLLKGRWLDPDLATVAGDWTQGRHLPVDSWTRHAWLPSPRWFADGWDLIEQQLWKSGRQVARFEGTVELAGEATWACDSQAQPYSFALHKTEQVVTLDFEHGFDAALADFGLTGHRGAVIARVMKLSQTAFSGYMVRIAQTTSDHPIPREQIFVTVGNRDPNGLSLLGRDATLGKDVGNRSLGELLAGKNAAAEIRGRAPYGGVFVGELFVFSRKLNAISEVADPAFDAIFGPFAPALGGDPASQSDAAGQAVTALAQLIADTLVHEIGHALGMASSIAGYHHEGDNGWRMDAGKHRTFQERAGLSSNPTWGPLDSAYLHKILPAW